MRFLPLIALCGVVFSAPAFSADAPPPVNADPKDVHESVQKGLAWLALHAAEKDVKRDESVYANGVAITSFAGLAFLASGSEPDKGDYGKQLRTVLDSILAAQKENGLLSKGTGPGPMYGHGYATLFLAEVQLRHKDDRVKAALQKAVNLIQSSQSKEGGWRYQPSPIDADVSVTACELNALLAARAAGCDVDEKAIHNAVEYVRRCQNHDGGFSYMASPDGIGGSGFARSAAALAVLLHSGAKPTDPDVRSGIGYVSGFPHDGKQRAEGHLFYGDYYASQWLPAANPAAHDSVVRELLAAQQKDGSWLGDFSTPYATANALIVLQAPEKRLWIFK